MISLKSASVYRHSEGIVYADLIVIFKEQFKVKKKNISKHRKNMENVENLR